MFLLLFIHFFVYVSSYRQVHVEMQQSRKRAAAEISFDEIECASIDDGDICPSSLRDFLKKKILFSFERWEGDLAAKETASTEIVSLLIKGKIKQKENSPTSSISQLRKVLSEEGIGIAKSLRARSGNIGDIFENDSVILDLDKFYDSYREHSKQNQEVFELIATHHNSIKTVVDSSPDQKKLEDYAVAAAAMGEKGWVKRGNDWMRDFAINFFKHGIAKRHYLKSIKSKVADLSSSQDIKTMGDSLLTDLTEVMEDGKIKLVDVGSCYNPFSDEAFFDVTALDLCPAKDCSSVFTCNFLELQIGEEDSDIIVEEMDTSDMGEPRTLILKQLPARSYDVVTISLVLNYLSTPMQRIEMIKRSKQLLMSVNVDMHPHKSGLLLIIEKESILHRGKYYPLFLKHWKNEIKNQGFELMKYEKVTCGTRSFHGFAFKTIASNASSPKDGDDVRGLWIKQDFDSLENQTSALDSFFGLQTT